MDKGGRGNEASLVSPREPKEEVTTELQQVGGDNARSVNQEFEALLVCTNATVSERNGTSVVNNADLHFLADVAQAVFY